MADALFVVSPSFTPSTFFSVGLILVTDFRSRRLWREMIGEINRIAERVIVLDLILSFFSSPLTTSQHYGSVTSFHLYPLDFRIIVTSKKKANNNMKRANEHARKKYLLQERKFTTG